jgi:energy-coupling factor transporter transmembrane protein EcfT
MGLSVPDLSQFRPDPVQRGIAALAATTGVMLCSEPVILLAGWVALVLPLCVAAGIIRPYLRFVLNVVVPVSIALFVVWGWMVGAPPSATPGSAPLAGSRFAAVIALRLAALGGIWQLSLLTVPPAELPRTLDAWGVRGGLLAVILGAISLVPEMRLRADQIITAREARGLVPNRRLWTRAMELPKLLRPLLAWALRSAIQRSEVWHERDLLSRLARREVVGQDRTRQGGSMLVLLLSVAWLLGSAATILW